MAFRDIFLPADILIPAAADMGRWSVIACDQFTSDPDYWRRVEAAVGDAPSTLKMIVPEAYLDDTDMALASADRAEVMRRYLESGVFTTLESSFVYVERETRSGGVRRGLVGAVDLDKYDFSGERPLPVRSTEATVVSRLPARIAVRRLAPLELPHVMMLIDDPEMTVIGPLAERSSKLCKLYDFDLMEGGGRVRGWRVTGADADGVLCAMRAFGDSPVRMIVGDGNHSLAAAKSFWDELKAGLSPHERERHPARFALVEVNSVYDPAIDIEPIHRVVFGVSPDALVSALRAVSADGGFPVTCVCGGRDMPLSVPAESYGALIGRVQDAIDGFIAENGGSVDYIHDEPSARALADGADRAAVLLPALDKSDLFRTVSLGRTFPRKSFSIGQARDKRYYLECRKIV